MYYIIEFLANRRNNKNPGQLHYMNMYPTINEELDVFKSIPIEENDVDVKEKQKIQYKFALSHIECDDLLKILQDKEVLE